MLPRPFFTPAVPHPAPGFRRATISRRPRATHDLIRGGAGRPGRRHSSGRYSSGVRPPRRERVPRGPGIHIAKRNDPPPPCSRVRRAGPSAPVRRPASPDAPAHPGPRAPPGPAPAQAATCVDVSRAAAPAITPRDTGRCQKMDKTTTRTRCGSKPYINRLCTRICCRVCRVNVHA